MQKGISTLIGIIIIVAVAIILFGGAFAYQYFALKQIKSTEVAGQKQQILNKPFPLAGGEPADQTADWKTYTNSQYGFEIKYPDGAKITDVDITGGRNVSIQMPVSGKNNLTGKVLEIAIVSQQYEHNGPILVPASCNSDTFYNFKTSNVVLNEMTFIKGDVSGAFGGMQSSSYAIEYCIMKDDKSFRLTSILSSPRYSGLPSFNVDEEKKVIDQIISTFKFIPVK